MAFVLGITGSIGSGKTTVAGLLRELGAAVIDADTLAREAVEPGRPALAEVVGEFGPGVLKPDGRLDRRALAGRVFSDRGALRRLCAIIHPRVLEEAARRLAALGESAVVVLDVPLLYEAGMEGMMDRVAVVTISENQRFARLRRRGLGEQAVLGRLGMQMAQARKRQLADTVIDNSGTLEAVRNQVQTLMKQITEEKSKRNDERQIQ